MVEEGLFERFPMRAVYGMHNGPSRPAGSFAMRAGPLMGAYDIFEIVVEQEAWRACRHALCREGPDAVRRAHDQRAADDCRAHLHPQDAAVVSITQVHGGDTWNVIPQEVRARAAPCARSIPTCRTPSSSACAPIVAGVAAAFGDEHATVRYRAPLSGHHQLARGNAARDCRRHGRGGCRAGRHRSHTRG